jgi:hypothetical protein
LVYVFTTGCEPEPVPVHVKRSELEARFDLEAEVLLTENYGLNTRDLSLAEEIIRDNREYMLEHWRLFLTNKYKR